MMLSIHIDSARSYALRKAEAAHSVIPVNLDSMLDTEWRYLEPQPSETPFAQEVTRHTLYAGCRPRKVGGVWVCR
jgi:hypothetical protein